MKVNIKKLDERAVIPEYAKDGDAGLDITAIEVNPEPTKGYIEYKTGIALEIPTGYVGLVFPRSSISKMGLVLSNSVGVIDSGYRGEILFRFKPMPGPKYEPGDRIGQIMIVPYPQIELNVVEELGTSERGTGGFGSSDRVAYAQDDGVIDD